MRRFVDVKVVIEGSAGDKAATTAEGVFFVGQANAKAIVDQKSFCALSGNRVKALVPAVEPTCKSQCPKEDFDKLVQCYKSCISRAASAGAKTVIITPLGVGVPLTGVLDNGDVIRNGTWGNLFWTQSKTSMAARQAVTESPFDGITVVFVVPADAFDDWDHAMDF